MKSLFVGKLVCNDSILQGSKVLTPANIKDVVAASLTFTPFSVAQLNLVKARVAEQYFPACRQLGYNTSFFRELTVCSYFTLLQGQSTTPTFDGVYIPFSGEIFLLPHDVCEFADVQEGACDAEFADANAQATAGERYLRRFEVTLGQNKVSIVQSIRQKLLGEESTTIDVKAIASMTATADVCVKKKDDGTTEEEVFDAMHFLYNGIK